MKKGKLIVLDGADGSGKATQAKLLVSRLKKEGYKVKALDFPQYEANFFGLLFFFCLSRKYGVFIAFSSHFLSVLDRYVSANQIHQGGKITDAKKRKAFLEWLDTLEFEVYGIPRPDLVCYLDVPRMISDRLLTQGRQGVSTNRSLRGRKDLAEKNKAHLDAAREGALKIIKQGNTWERIGCAPKGELLSREEIAEQIWSKVKNIL